MKIIKTQDWSKVSNILPHDEWQCECGKVSTSYRLNPVFFDGPIEKAWVPGVPIGDQSGLCQACAIRLMKEQQQEHVLDAKRSCRECGCELTNENWSNSFQQHRNRICKQCHQKLFKRGER